MNQCDGCLGGFPIKNGLHYNESRGKRLPFMACCKQDYKEVRLQIRCPVCGHKQEKDVTSFCEECGFDQLIRS